MSLLQDPHSHSPTNQIIHNLSKSYETVSCERKEAEIEMNILRGIEIPEVDTSD